MRCWLPSDDCPTCKGEQEIVTRVDGVLVRRPCPRCMGGHRKPELADVVRRRTSFRFFRRGHKCYACGHWVKNGQLCPACVRRVRLSRSV
jgi:hypothetical protein